MNTFSLFIDKLTHNLYFILNIGVEKLGFYFYKIIKMFPNECYLCIFINL